MAKYRVLEKSFINGDIHEAGTEVDYDGLPGANLEPLDDDAKAAAVKAAEVIAQAQKPVMPMAQLGIDPQAFAAAIAKAVADMQAAVPAKGK